VTRDVWVELSTSILDILTSITLADLVKRSKKAAGKRRAKPEAVIEKLAKSPKAKK
jgi:DNA-binding IscR family transcriptional regulator